VLRAIKHSSFPHVCGPAALRNVFSVFSFPFYLTDGRLPPLSDPTLTPGILESNAPNWWVDVLPQLLFVNRNGSQLSWLPTGGGAANCSFTVPFAWVFKLTHIHKHRYIHTYTCSSLCVLQIHTVCFWEPILMPAKLNEDVNHYQCYRTDH